MRFGLLGRTLKHSFSKVFFTEKFDKEHIAGCSYENFELASIELLPELLLAMPDLVGFNITIPYKEEILPYLHWQNAIVKSTGACNCVKIRNGQLYGFNTDVIGFRQTLQAHLRPSHKMALILGTGGAARAVQYALTQIGLPFLTVSRKRKANCILYEEITPELLKTHTVIINTTPLGMYPEVQAAPPIPYEYITSNHFLYDLVYNPPKTSFLSKGEERGAAIFNGYEMLVLQAEESWSIWMNKDLPPQQ